MLGWQIHLNFKYSKGASRLGEMVTMYFSKILLIHKDVILKPVQAFSMYRCFLWV